MTDVSLRRPAAEAALAPFMIRRRRALRIAPPSNFMELKAAYARVDEQPGIAPALDWRADLRFFVGCYAAGLAFFLILLS